MAPFAVVLGLVLTCCMAAPAAGIGAQRVVIVDHPMYVPAPPLHAGRYGDVRAAAPSEVVLAADNAADARDVAAVAAAAGAAFAQAGPMDAHALAAQWGRAAIATAAPRRAGALAPLVPLVLPLLGLPQPRRALREDAPGGGDSGAGAAAAALGLLQQLLQLPLLALGRGGVTTAAPAGPPTPAAATDEAAAAPLVLWPTAQLGGGAALAGGDAGGDSGAAHGRRPRAAAATLQQAPPPSRGPSRQLALTIQFESVGVFSYMLRLPESPRSMSVQVYSEQDGELAASQDGLPYADSQAVTLDIPATGNFTVEIRDEGAPRAAHPRPRGALVALQGWPRRAVAPAPCTGWGPQLEAAYAVQTRAHDAAAARVRRRRRLFAALRVRARRGQRRRRRRPDRGGGGGAAAAGRAAGALHKAGLERRALHGARSGGGRKHRRDRRQGARARPPAARLPVTCSLPRYGQPGTRLEQLGSSHAAGLFERGTSAALRAPRLTAPLVRSPAPRRTAQLTVWTQSDLGGPPVVWFSRYTDDEGFGLFFLPLK